MPSSRSQPNDTKEVVHNDSSKPMKHVGSGLLFLSANVIAGLIHYFFQVLASKDLDARGFAEFNAWFADLSLFFVITGLLQYSSNFFPVSLSTLRKSIVALNLIGLVILGLWFITDVDRSFERAALVVSGGAMLGWMMGQTQVRVLFIALSITNVVAALSKVGVVIFSVDGSAAIEKFQFAVFASFLPALWFMSIAIWKARDPEHSKVENRFSWHLWSAPLILSVAGALIPQMDLVVMSRILPSSEFENFARASLFYKGIYFVMFIGSQWLLPQQIVSATKGLRSNFSNAKYAVTAVGISSMAALIGPHLGTTILGWNESPPAFMILYACLNMSLLTWCFILIQKTCVLKQVRRAGFAVAILCIEGLLQLFLMTSLLDPSIEVYFSIAIITQIGVILLLDRPDSISGSPSLSKKMASQES